MRYRIHLTPLGDQDGKRRLQPKGWKRPVRSSSPTINPTPPSSMPTNTMSRSATSTCLLNTCRDGDSTTSLGSLFQCLTTLSTLHQLRCPSLDTLQHLNVPLVVRGPKLNTVFEVRPHQCRVQGHDHFPSPAGHTIFDTSQDAVDLLGHLGTLLAHIQPAVNQHPQVLLCWAAFQPLFPKPVALHGVAVAQVQDPALSLVEPHTIGPSPSIQPVQVPLQSLPPLKQINTPTQLGVICKLTEVTLNPLIQIIDKDIKQDWPQNSPGEHCFKSSLFSQASRLPSRFVLRHMGTACSCAFKISFLKNAQPSWTPLPFRTVSQGTLSTSVLNRSKSTLKKSMVVVLLPPPYFTTNRELYHIMAAKPKMASNHHTSHQSSSVCKQQVKRGPSPVFFPATDRIEENTTCAPDPSTYQPSALKSLLIAFGLLSATSSLPTCTTNSGGSHNTWGWLAYPRQPPGWTFTYILICLALKFQSPISVV
ncbi:hypothetical protein QYF61_006027 [Mycteria americana]|uniref:Uncharacterized protein n=1 Tax=Mycteria americana TaxID=33587 RepID=A0AAN7N7X0_MYCAM|nr:hypothetical protein QYF61_006027 [Mycteria americana]